jgi:exonuclease SbcD
VHVTVEDGRIVDVTPLALDGARWAHLTVDVHHASSEGDVVACIAAALAGAHHEAEGRPLAIRLTLTGATLLHNQLVARREILEADFRARAFQLGDDCWVEQLKVRTTAPPRPVAALSSAESLYLDQLLDAAMEDPEFALILAELIETVRAKLPMELHDDLLAGDLHKALAGEARAVIAGALP